MYHISRIPTSITAITLAVLLTLQMIKPTSRNMMRYHISSTANSLMRRLDCTIMVQGI